MYINIHSGGFDIKLLQIDFKFILFMKSEINSLFSCFLMCELLTIWDKWIKVNIINSTSLFDQMIDSTNGISMTLCIVKFILIT